MNEQLIKSIYSSLVGKGIGFKMYVYNGDTIFSFDDNTLRVHDNSIIFNRSEALESLLISSILKDVYSH
jgi:hypothetical protein